MLPNEKIQRLQVTYAVEWPKIESHST